MSEGLDQAPYSKNAGKNSTNIVRKSGIIGSKQKNDSAGPELQMIDLEQGERRNVNQGRAKKKRSSPRKKLVGGDDEFFVPKTRGRRVDIKKQKRTVIIGETRKDLGDNKIRTSKYTWLNFIPLNLLEQFAKIANVYFLVRVTICMFFLRLWLRGFCF